MFFNSYSNNNILSKKMKSQKFFHNMNDYADLLYKNSFSKTLKNNYLSSSASKKNNYINYTFSDKNNKNIEKIISTNKNKKILVMPKKHNKKSKLTIVNDYFKSFHNSSNWSRSLKFSKESNINYKSIKNIMNNMSRDSNSNNNIYNEELYNRNNISKISNNNISMKNFESFLQSKNETNDLFDTYKERAKKENEELNNLINKNINKYHKIKVNSVLNYSVPIKKRISILKEAKSSIDKIKKNRVNSSSSFKGFFEESNHSKFNNYSTEKNKHYNDVSSYYFKDNYENGIMNKRPIVIKYMPKPKLSVPKFINVNKIEIL